MDRGRQFTPSRSLTPYDEKGDSMFALAPGHGLKVGQEVTDREMPTITPNAVTNGDGEAFDRVRTHRHGLRYVTADYDEHDNLVNRYVVKKIHGWHGMSVNVVGTVSHEDIDHGFTRRMQRGEA